MNQLINFSSHPSLYEEDYYLWIEKTIDQLRANNFAEVDLENLVEEMEDMGRSQKDALESNLKILLMHLLKSQYQIEKRSNSWRYTIVEHRQRINKSLKNSPSLKPYLNNVFDECYQNARELAAAETGLSIDQFPVNSPFSIEAILERDIKSV